MRRTPKDLVFTERFDALAALSYRVAYRILGDRHVAEEVAQETLVRAYCRWRKVSPYAEPWVARVAGNLALDIVRRKPAPPLTERTEAPSDRTIVLRLELQRALAELPVRQREALVLRYLADMPESEVGRVLGIRPGTVKQHLHRGAETMRDLLVEPIGG